MEAIQLRNELVGDDAALCELAATADEIMLEFRRLQYEPIPRGKDEITGLSWRCRSFANANLIRGEELFRLCVLAINDGALIGTFVLARALDETLAAVIFAKRRIQRLSNGRDPVALADFLKKLLVGNRYMAEKDDEFPSSHNVLTMVQEVDKHFRDLVGGKKPKLEKDFELNYAFCSEFVHPSLGSFAAYMRIRNGATVFDKPGCLEPNDLKPLLSQISVAAKLLLSEAAELSAIEDLPATWPNTVGS